MTSLSRYMTTVLGDGPLHVSGTRPICVMSFGTMDINALVISGSDPGAVPGVSTKNPSLGIMGTK